MANIAQLLSQPSDAFGAFKRGSQFNQQQQQFEAQQQQLAKLQDLQSKIPAFLSGGEGAPSIGELAGLSNNPINAVGQLQSMQEFQQNAPIRADIAQAKGTDAKFKNIVSGANFIKTAGITGGAPAMLSAIDDRIEDLSRAGKPINDTMEVKKALLAGDVETANSLLDQAIEAGNQKLGGASPRWFKGTPTVDEQGNVLDVLHRTMPNGDIETKKVIVGKPQKTDAQTQADIEVEKKRKLAEINANKEIGVKEAERNIDRVDGFIEVGNNQTDTLETIQRLDSIPIETGNFEPIKNDLAAVFNGLGVNGNSLLGVDAGNAQQFKSETAKLLKASLQANTGVQTDGDADRERETFASLKNEEQANKFINNSLKATALRKQERGNFLQNMTNEGATSTEALKAWGKFKNETPKLSSFIKDPRNDLPLYFYQFKDLMNVRNPGLGEQAIIDQWRDINSEQKRKQIEEETKDLNLGGL